LLNQGIALIAVLAFLLSWVTVGFVQLPAEASLLGKKFALLRNAVAFASAITMAALIVATLRLL